jgi:hypothetical protein
MYVAETSSYLWNGFVLLYIENSCVKNGILNVDLYEYALLLSPFPIIFLFVFTRAAAVIKYCTK